MKNNMDKGILRRQMLEKRNGLSDKEVVVLSNRISNQLFRMEMFKKSMHICIYQAFRNEVSCTFICQEAYRLNKHVYTPVTDLTAKEISFYEVFPDTEWITGAYGIKEPKPGFHGTRLSQPALILMPGLMFDKNKNRIGYGGGYYDKYLAHHTEHTTIALCYHFQIVPFVLPYEEYDKIPDYIITESGII